MRRKSARSAFGPADDQRRAGVLCREVRIRGEGGEQERELAAKYRAWAERLHFDYPYVGGVLERIAESYEREAGWQDSEATIRKRVRS